VYRVSIGVVGAINDIDESESEKPGRRDRPSQNNAPVGFLRGLFVDRRGIFLKNRILVGGANPLCPVASHVDLLGDCQGVIDLDAEVAHGALNLRMAQQS